VGFTGVSIGAKNEIFFQERLDTPNQFEFALQIKVYVKSNSGPAGSKHAAIAARDCPSGKSMRAATRYCLDARQWMERRRAIGYRVSAWPVFR
jgi:hypothetical protein